MTHLPLSPHAPPVAAPLRIKDMRPDAVAASLLKDARLLVPVGTLAAHGPHLPLGVDTIIVDHLADDLSARFGILRAPTIEYGVNANVPPPAPGTAGVRKKTLHRLLNDLLAGWEAHGVEEFVLLTAHRHDAHQEALATVITAHARVRVVDVLGVDLHDLLDGQDEAMHGGEVDTSLMLHLAPSLVDLTAVVDNMVEREVLRRFRAGHGLARWRPRAAPLSPTTLLGRPSLASAEKGAALYDRILTRIAERVLGPAAAPPEV